jgi:hypothetical protein
MGVHNVDVVERLDLGEVEAEGFESPLEFALGALGDFAPRLSAANVQVALVGVLFSPAMNLDFNHFCQFTAEVIDVDSGSPVDLGWIFAGEQAGTHWWFLHLTSRPGRGLAAEAMRKPIQDTGVEGIDPTMVIL